MLSPEEFANTTSASADYAGGQMGAKAGIQNFMGGKPQQQKGGGQMAKNAAKAQGVKQVAKGGASTAEFGMGAASGAADAAGGAGALAELAPLAVLA